MNAILGLFNLGGGEVIVVLVVVLILFGAKKIPELAKGLGQGIKEFKKATKEVSEEVTNAMDEGSAPQRRISNTASSPNVEPSQTVPQSSTPNAPKA